MDSLRSELSTVIERSRMSDRKQQELERIITRLEDEASRYSTQIMELEERLTDKMAQNATLEGKVSQRNSKISELQIDIEKKIDEINNLEHEVCSFFVLYLNPQLSFQGEVCQAVNHPMANRQAIFAILYFLD